MTEKDTVTEDFLQESLRHFPKEFFLGEPFNARVYDFFKVSDCTKMDTALDSFIQVNDKFHIFDENTRKWNVMTVTYKRSGVVFYKLEESQSELHLDIGSVLSYSLVPLTINVNRLIDIMSPLHNIDRDQLLQVFKTRGFKFFDLPITIKYE